MLIEERFRAIILAVPEVAALIEERLSPIFLRPGELLPAATYSRVSTRFDMELDDNAIEYPRMEVTVWGLEYIAIKTAIEALKAAFRSLKFATPIGAILVTAEEDIFDERYQHADGIGVPGTRLECELTIL